MNINIKIGQKCLSKNQNVSLNQHTKGGLRGNPLNSSHSRCTSTDTRRRAVSEVYAVTACVEPRTVLLRTVPLEVHERPQKAWTVSLALALHLARTH